jgi:branched-chain amino acid transport system substrate-binding protein
MNGIKVHKWPLFPSVLIAIILTVGCGSRDEGEGGPAPIKVGAIFDLTGVTSDVGTTYAEGLQGYVDWLNRNGGIEGRPIDLIFQDYGYKVDQAELLYTQFVQEGAVVFQGWGTGDTEALRGRIADDKIPFMSASYSYVLGNPEEAPYNFLVGTTYSEQFFILLDWILENHTGDETPSVALMHNPSPFGLSPYQQGGREYAKSKGIELTAHEMPRGATDYTAELTKIREEGAQYVVFQNTSGPVALVLRNARGLGLDIDFLCLNWCSNELLTELAGEAAEGVVGSMLFSPPGPEVEGLKDAAAYLESRGSSLEEKGSVYGQGWWTMAVMLEGVRRVVVEGKEVTGENVKMALESLENFDTRGVTVPITFTAEDHRGSNGMRLFKVENGKWHQLTDFRTTDYAPAQ